MISAIAWVPAGIADPNPKRYELSAAEREILNQVAMEQEQQDQNHCLTENDKQQKQKNKRMMKVMLPQLSSTEVNELPADLRMDEYSDNDEGGAAAGRLLLVDPSDDDNSNNDENDAENNGDYERDADNVDANKPDENIQNGDSGDDDSDDDDDDNLADVPDTREYLPIDVEGLEAMGLYNVGMGPGAGMEEMNYDDEGSDADDVKLTEDDAIVLVAKTEEDFSALEVHVYDQKRGTLYVHHDIALPAFPLCLAHGQQVGGGTDGRPGNFCAVGTFDTGIEIWNLDILNPLEPSCILGGELDTSKDNSDAMNRQIAKSKPGASVGKPSLRPGSHTDSVMSLAWNSIHRQVIASGSADKTVKLWDITQAGSHATAKSNAATFRHHKGKVQSVVWHPKEGTLLATGSYDKTVALVDARSNGDNAKFVKISSDCEAVAWDPFRPENLMVGTEDGSIFCWDVRKFQTPVWTVVANEFGGLSDLSFNRHISGFFATCSSVDKTVTLWDLHPNGADPPRPFTTKDMCAGKLYSVAFYESSPWLLGCGGAGGMLALWSLEDEQAVQRTFAGRLESVGIHPPSSSGEEPPNKGDLEAMVAERPQQTPPPSKKKKNEKRKAHKKGR